MASHREALHRLLDAISAMREAGYTQENVQELVGDAFGHCTECGPTRRHRLRQPPPNRVRLSPNPPKRDVRVVDTMDDG